MFSLLTFNRPPVDPLNMVSHGNNMGWFLHFRGESWTRLDSDEPWFISASCGACSIAVLSAAKIREAALGKHGFTSFYIIFGKIVHIHTLNDHPGFPWIS
jgi:hypothetical protein